MSCDDCGRQLFVCGESPRLIYVQKPGDISPKPVWTSVQCTGETLTGVELYSEEALTNEVSGYTMADQVTAPETPLGLSCESPVVTNLCPATLNPLVAAIQDVEQSVDELIALQGAGFDSLGDPLPLNFDSLPQTLGYVSGNLTTIVVVSGGDTYTQTFSYTGADLTGISAWVKS